MKKIMFAILLAFVMGLPAYAVLVFAGNWKLKEGSEVRFVGGKIKGYFESLKTDIQFDKAHPEQAKISATVDANSLGTGFFIKTSHAKDAIDAEHYPNITFVSSSVTKSGDGFEAVGKLTLKGVTKTASIHFTFDDKGNEGIFKGSFKVITKAFNVTRNGSPDELMIYLTVPVLKG